MLYPGKVKFPQNMIEPGDGCRRPKGLQQTSELNYFAVIRGNDERYITTSFGMFNPVYRLFTDKMNAIE